jgi:hypothetical protein
MRSVLLAALLAAGTSQVFAQNAGRAPGMQEGVKVHGDWVIEVRNPDGKLAHRREFKNALMGREPPAVIQVTVTLSFS